MESVNEFVTRLFADEATMTNERGNEFRCAFLPSERYRIDFADDFKAEGWEQFDTDQDAPYFGVWVNKTTMQTLTYAEGDWVLVTCPDWEHYRAEIEDACRFYGEGFEFKAFDIDRGPGVPNLVTTYRQDRQRFLTPPN